MTLTVALAEEGSVVPYTYSMRFAGMDYDALIADVPKMQLFKMNVRSRVALAIGLPIGNVEVHARTGCLWRPRCALHAGALRAQQLRGGCCFSDCLLLAALPAAGCTACWPLADPPLSHAPRRSPSSPRAPSSPRSCCRRPPAGHPR